MFANPHLAGSRMKIFNEEPHPHLVGSSAFQRRELCGLHGNRVSAESVAAYLCTCVPDWLIGRLSQQRRRQPHHRSARTADECRIARARQGERRGGGGGTRRRCCHALRHGVVAQVSSSSSFANRYWSRRRRRRSRWCCKRWINLQRASGSDFRHCCCIVFMSRFVSTTEAIDAADDHNDVSNKTVTWTIVAICGISNGCCWGENKWKLLNDSSWVFSDAVISGADSTSLENHNAHISEASSTTRRYRGPFTCSHDLICEVSANEFS